MLLGALPRAPRRPAILFLQRDPAYRLSGAAQPISARVSDVTRPIGVQDFPFRLLCDVCVQGHICIQPTKKGVFLILLHGKFTFTERIYSQDGSLAKGTLLSVNHFQI